MTVVLDTNVIVSGLLTPFSPCGEIVRMVSSGELNLCLDARLLAEYSEVLQRPRFAFDHELIAAFLDHVSHAGILVSGSPLDRSLPDPDDEAFLEVALAGRAECLITGNIRHFPANSRAGVAVLSPSGFLEYCRQGGSKSRGRRSKDRS